MLAYAIERGNTMHFYLMAALLSLWPALVLGQATKTSQIASATKVMKSMGSPSANSFCTTYIGGKPTTVATVRETGISTVKVVASSTSTRPAGPKQTTATATSTSTATKTTTWTRATQYPETEDAFTTETATLIDPEFTQYLPGTTTFIPSNTATVTEYYRKKKRHVERAVAVPTPLKKFPATILSSACSTYLGTATSSFTHSFFTGTTTSTISTKWATVNAPPVTTTRIVTTTRLALVTTTAQVTATRVNVDTETVTQYSGTVTTIDPNYATTELGPGTTTVTTSLPSPVPETVIGWDDQPAGWLQLDGFYGLRWQTSGKAVDVAGNSNAQAYSKPNYLALTDTWHPTIRSYNGNAILTLRSLTCVRLSYAQADSYAAIIGSRGGQEIYVKRLNCPAVNPAVNDFRRDKLPAVDTFTFLYSTGYQGGIDDLTLLPYQ